MCIHSVDSASWQGKMASIEFLDSMTYYAQASQYLGISGLFSDLSFRHAAHDARSAASAMDDRSSAASTAERFSEPAQKLRQTVSEIINYQVEELAVSDVSRCQEIILEICPFLFSVACCTTIVLA